LERSSTVYALVSLWQMPEEPWNELRPAIEGGIGMLIGRTPGVIDGYWTYEPANSKAIAFILLETADHAYDLRNALEGHMEMSEQGGIDLELIRVQEIVAHLAVEGRSIDPAWSGAT
jgi:hypothetical protein